MFLSLGIFIGKKVGLFTVIVQYVLYVKKTKKQIVQTDRVVTSADTRQERASREASVHTKQTGGHIY